MKKVIIRLISVILFLLVIFQPICVFSAVIDFDKKCNLTLIYSKNGNVFSNLEINIYRVANCDFEMVSPFDNYPVNVTNIKSQTEWNSISATLSGYAQSENIPAYKTAKTDNNGNAVFEGIDVGLYLISGVVTEKNKKLYTFFDNVVYLPADLGGQYLYNLEVKPKSEEIVFEEKEYSIYKLWNDDGKNRPKSIMVDILKDGKTVDTVVLNSKNNWKHTFKTQDVKCDWSIVEKNVPKGYTVKVTEKGTSFVLLNTKGDPFIPGKPSTNVPQTGDTSQIELYILVCCISGMFLIVLGVGLRRKENANKQ